MNVIDLLGIVPYFISLGLSNMKSSGEYQDEMRRIAQVCCLAVLLSCCLAALLSAVLSSL